MDLKRKVALSAVTIVIALGSGYALQSTTAANPKRVALVQKPVAITPLAAGLGPAATRPATTSPATTSPAVTAALVLPEKPPRPDLLPDDNTPDLPATVFAPKRPEAPATAKTPAAAAALPDGAAPKAFGAAEVMLSGDSTNCPKSLSLTAAPKAMIDVTLLAPCSAGERVVLRHGGLAVTGQTSLSGALFVTLPAMDEEATVTILFPDGTEAAQDISLPDLPIYRRIAVQWQDKDRFQLHAFEDGAAFGSSGHISATDPHNLFVGIPSTNGFMTLLGDDKVAFPMLAEVYTYPIDFAVPVNISVEVAVTGATCSRELLGELLLSEGGNHLSTDLTLTTPDCAAIGDVLVLNNPLPDLKLATAN